MPDSLKIQLDNQSDSHEVYAYVTGQALQHNNALMLLKADGNSIYYPQSPSKTGADLAEDCAIPLNAPGSSPKTITIPQIAGGRIWFSRGDKLQFTLNPGPALVEPSVLNTGDPNINVDFAFCELTLNSDQIYANISYVDFVPKLPTALTLQTTNGVQHVSGMRSDGLDRIADGLAAQAKKDGKPWGKLLMKTEDGNLRALNPTHGGVVGADFSNYYETYVTDVWKKYSQQGDAFKINTQAGAGTVTGSVNSQGQLVIGGEQFSKPNTSDIFSCNTGPFAIDAGASDERKAIIPRLAAAFIRSTLVSEESQPSSVSTYYNVDPTNHYCRIVHENNVDGKGYAFAYDDVEPDGGKDQSGKVNAGDPKVLIVTVGGKNAYAGDKMPGDGLVTQNGH